MLFNSYEYVFCMLPSTLLGYYLLRRWRGAQMLWLSLASLFFYSWWDVRALPILLTSIGFNYSFAIAILRARGGAPRLSFGLAVVAIAGNVTLLGFFKYAAFLADNLCTVFSVTCFPVSAWLPIGISFFTFTQIAFIADCYVGRAADRSFLRYLLFVTYFPHLIAGPILHHADMMPQFRRPDRVMGQVNSRIAVGFTVFVVGLFKKVCLADSVAPLVSPVFDATTMSYSTSDAWVAALAYTLQLYFDFSGYCDMALGASYMLGIRLPINFNSPYQSRSIIEFWRRWHITLSAFLRDYVYIALGGNRRGEGRRYLNIVLTMLIGGLWHGAAWTFVAWGALHAFYLVVNHAWKGTQKAYRLADIPMPIAWGLTFLCVMVAWVPFRAPSLASAGQILLAMAGFAGAPEAASLASYDNLALVGALFAIALWAPNLQQAFRRNSYYLPADIDPSRVQWTPSLRWGVPVAIASIIAVVFISRQSEFLYFQF